MRVSIITVCFNSERYIEETIKSVINQTYNDIEYIIVDGMSTDSTPQIIEKYRSHITKYLRGKDKNMYDAINKGMAASTGDFIEILNSDDLLYDKYVIENVVKKINGLKNKYEVYYGYEIDYYQNYHLFCKNLKFDVSYRQLLCSKKLTYVGHGAVFISRRVYHCVGNYECDIIKAASDYDYMLRAIKLYKFKYINIPIQLFRRHNESITSSGIIEKETNIVLTNNGYYDVPIVVRKLLFYKDLARYYLKNLIPLIRLYIKIHFN